MELKEIKCPCCGANLTDNDKKGNKLICSYCSTVLWAENLKQAEMPEQKKLAIPTCCYMDSEDYIEKIDLYLKKVCEWLDEFPTIEAIEKRMQDMLYMREETITPIWHEEQIPKIADKINLDIGETFVMYKTAALLGFNKLKTGMFMTDRRVGYLDGKKVYSLYYIEIENIMISSETFDAIWFFPNSNEKIFLSGYGCSNDDEALITAYLMLRVCESKRSFRQSIELRIKDGFYKN